MLKRCLWTAAVCVTVIGTVLADSFELEGVVRDLRRGDQEGGHVDFQTAEARNRLGHARGLVKKWLDQDRKPVYTDNHSNADPVYSAASFHQWYHDTPGVNTSQPLSLTVDNNESQPGGIYTFSSNSFFPIDGQLLGNQGLSHNYHFTFELHTQFTYVPGQTFTFKGDGDVWVFVDGIQVIDLGGVHSAATGRVLLLDGKAFVDTSDFPLGGMVQEVSPSMAKKLNNTWAMLNLPGICPISPGDHFIDLNLTDGRPDIRVDFNGLSATVRSAQPIMSIDVQFEDGSTQSIAGPDQNDVVATITGTGEHTDKIILGIWVQSGEANTEPEYFSIGGDGFSGKMLDFFFAERHTSQSNFQIKTNMVLQPIPTSLISSLHP